MLTLGPKQIPATLAELVQPQRAALLLWDMEYAIAPNAFNYTSILSNLQRLSALARRRGAGLLFGSDGIRSPERRSACVGADQNETR